MELLLELLSQFLASVPKIAAALALLIVGWILAKLISAAIKRLLVAINVDKLGDKLNEIDLIEKSPVNVVFSAAIAKIFYYIILLVFFIAASDALGLAVVSELIADLIGYLPKLVLAILMLVVGLLVANFIKNIVATACKSLQVPGGKVIAGFIFYFLFINIFLSAMEQAEINVDFLSSNLSLLFGGIVLAFAVGYGFASRDMMANLLASIYSKDKFKVGDVIKVGEVKGTIVRLDASSVTIETSKNQTIIPLSQLANDIVEKY
ncbi:MAG: mechanosensitive ion channel domain-containing protein [Bacteroidota bacterium]